MSAHVPNMMEDIIYSLVENYCHLNTYTKDYHKMSIKLSHRHVAQGWKHATMEEYILKTDYKINLRMPIADHIAADSQSQLHSNKERLFIHMEYHPINIPKRLERAPYNHHCKSTSKSLGIHQTTIAYS